ncbi:hypothetical protein M8494_11315 [Serratia ureilytica]
MSPVKVHRDTPGQKINYDFSYCCMRTDLRWDKGEGLEETPGLNGVTSNYRFDLAEYTATGPRNERRRVIFSQPPLPIKCAGAPQKALYLSCDHWRRQGILNNINVNFALRARQFSAFRNLSPADRVFGKIPSTGQLQSSFDPC